MAAVGQVLDQAAGGLNLLSALAAFAAAWLWYLSARNKLPPMVTYFDATPEDDPFLVALQQGTSLNRRAALFAAAAAACSGLATLTSMVAARTH